MLLPQEICDLIIDHLHEDKPSLHCCSLVSRGWVHRSRTHIFYFLVLGGRLWQRWIDTFSPSNLRIHSFVRGLKLCPPTGLDLAHLVEYLPAFRNLQYLYINGRNTVYRYQQFPCIRWFGHLRNTLKVLELNYVAINPRIIAGFPRLERLILRLVNVPPAGDPDENDDIPESDLRDAFRGSLTFQLFPRHSEVELFTAFADYPLNYDKIEICLLYAGGGMFQAGVINRLISRCFDTLEVFDIRLRDEQCHLGLDLSPFRRLREISLGITIGHGLRSYFPRFSNITSGAISKITIVIRLGSYATELDSLFGGEYGWTEVDEDLLRLAELQGGNDARQVEFVIDLSLANTSRPRERDRDWWIRRASECAFSKFSQAGTIEFILPPPVDPFPSGDP